MTFDEYIHKRRVTKTPMGDFVVDARWDHGASSCNSWKELRTHLEEYGVDDRVVRAARKVWRGYRRYILAPAIPFKRPG